MSFSFVRLLLILILSSTITAAFAQTDDSQPLIDVDVTESSDSISIKEKRDKELLSFPKRRVGFTPTSFFNFYYGPQFSYDFGLTDQVNFGTELGILPFKLDSRGPSVLGFRIKAVIETLIARDESFSLSAGLGLLYRRTTWSVRRDFFDDTNNYAKIFLGRSTRVIAGGFISSNIVIKASDKVFVEVGGGLGLGVLDQKSKFPEETNGLRGGFFNQRNFFWTQNGAFPIISSHINVSYALTDKKREKTKRQKRKRKRRRRRR